MIWLLAGCLTVAGTQSLPDVEPDEQATPSVNEEEAPPKGGQEEPRSFGPRRMRNRILRENDELITPPPPKPTEPNRGLGGARPRVLQSRSPAVAGLLAMVPGFGTGLFYAGNHRRGAAFAVVDTFLVGTLAGVGAGFAKNDARPVATRNASKRDALQRTTWMLGGLLVTTRIAQALFSVRSARSTNEKLGGFSFVPVGEGRSGIAPGLSFGAFF